jgi:hypothetical protein
VGEEKDIHHDGHNAKTKVCRINIVQKFPVDFILVALSFRKSTAFFILPVPAPCRAWKDFVVSTESLKDRRDGGHRENSKHDGEKPAPKCQASLPNNNVPNRKSQEIDREAY